MAKKKIVKFKKSKKIKGKSRKWLILVLLVSILAMGAYLIKSEIEVYKLQKERQTEEEINETLTRTKEELVNEKEIINTDGYIENLARRDLRLVKSNELIFILPKANSDEKTSEDKASDEEKSGEKEKNGKN